MSTPNYQLLNRHLSGVRRQTQKLSLNSPAPSPQQPQQQTTSATADQDASGPVPSTSAGPSPSLQSSVSSPAGNDASGASADEQSQASASGSNTKRKLRLARDPATPKRIKSSTGTSRSAGGGAAAGGNGADREPPTTRLRDLGGVDECVEKMLELVALPLCHPEVYLHTGVRPPRGVLLVGPPGCGKTMLAGAIAGELGMPFISISAPSIVSGMSGESEKTLRETFEEAARLAPCILFIDEIDAITPKRETAQREMERRIVAQLLTCMDDLAWDKTGNKPVMILGATNRPDSLDPALRRAGRFDAEITMGVPDEQGREKILRVLMAKLRLAGDFDYKFLAKSTPGYVGADLSALTGAAGVIAVKRIFEQLGVEVPSDSIPGEQAAANLLELRPEAAEADGMALDDDESAPQSADALLDTKPTVSGAATPVNEESGPTAALGDGPGSSLPPFSTLPPNLALLPISTFLRSHPSSLTPDQLETLCLTNADFTAALSVVQPSSQREGFTTVPNVSWADLGALQQIREEMRMSIVRPIKRPELFQMLGIQAPCGVLLWGPPGCGKTLLAKAVANESRANFISVKGPELLNKYVGESERAVRQVFARARASSPCIIFFDELDAMVPRRDDSLSESSARLVNTLLTELDGLEPRKQVFVIGATNRPDILDPAMVRPGRLDKLLYVDLPTRQERVDILKAQTRKTPMDDHVDLQEIALSDKADGFSGADLSALVREAAVMALRDVFDSVEMDKPFEQQQQEQHTSQDRDEPLKVKVFQKHFEQALDRTSPSVSVQQRKRFNLLRAKFMGQPIGHAKEVVQSTAMTTRGDAAAGEAPNGDADASMT
ncbi:Ribosome biogenesis ATPase rix7 [Microbotryomycetes sp. JL201]|nr:Ribosome biogenesis ATPase rix7 [Microbotryomycetes sp. JL201]